MDLARFAVLFAVVGCSSSADRIADAAAVTDGAAVDAAAPPDAPALDAPALDAPALDAPALDAPALDAPALDATALDAPALDAPAPDAPAPDAPAPDAPAIVCRTPAACTGDLSNIGTGNYSVAFTINTSATVGSAIIAQRGACRHSFFWDIRLLPNGTMGVEFDDNDVNYRSFASTRAVNDGANHTVWACRVAGVDYLYVDGVLDVSGTNAVNLSTTYAPLQIGTSPCVGADGTTALVGTVSNVCVGAL